MMAKNKLSDLNDHLFMQLERLSDDDIMSGDSADVEINRARAVASVSDQIISNAGLQLKAAELIAKHGDRMAQHMPALEHKK